MHPTHTHAAHNQLASQATTPATVCSPHAASQREASHKRGTRHRRDETGGGEVSEGVSNYAGKMMAVAATEAVRVAAASVVAGALLVQAAARVR